MSTNAIFDRKTLQRSLRTCPRLLILTGKRINDAYERVYDSLFRLKTFKRSLKTCLQSFISTGKNYNEGYRRVSDRLFRLKKVLTKLICIRMLFSTEKTLQRSLWTCPQLFILTLKRINEAYRRVYDRLFRLKTFERSL